MFIYLKITSKTDIAIVLSIFIFLVSSFIIYFKILSKIDFFGEFQKIEKNLVIYSGMANHFKNGIAVGGNLFLLNDKLIFQSNLINFTNRHELIIPLNQVENIDFTNTLGIVGNGMNVKINNGKLEQFVVNRREIWKEQIEKNTKR